MSIAETQAVYAEQRAAGRDYFLLGLGRRRKLVWRDYALYDALTWERLKHWPAGRDAWVKPDQHEVWFELPSNPRPAAARAHEHEDCEGQEDEDEVDDSFHYWPMQVEDTERGTFLGNRGSLYTARAHYSIAIEGKYLSESPVHLPLYSGILGYGNLGTFHEYDPLLRALLGEILFNVRAADGAPIPNLFAYTRPSYRAAAAVAMVLERTKNLHVIFDWVHALRDPFDGTAIDGQDEPDNLGQLLYLVSLVADRSHPVVATVLEQIPRFRRGDDIAGPTDGVSHPVYQTKWLKFGLRRLGLDDPFVIPHEPDSYSSLFWWDYTDQHVPGPRLDARLREHRPYFAWAEAHFNRDAPPMPPGLIRRTQAQSHFTGPYPLTWETDACGADYDAVSKLSQADARARTCRPHAWHAAEMFLYLLEHGRVIQEEHPLLAGLPRSDEQDDDAHSART